jgi:hypothetical protein
LRFDLVEVHQFALLVIVLSVAHLHPA